MDELSKVIPMRPLRDVLAELEKLIDSEQDNAPPPDGPCRRCNGTGTEVIYNEQTKLTSGRPCGHLKR